MFGFAYPGSTMFGGLLEWLFGPAPDTTTIYGPFQTFADRLVILDPASRVATADPSHGITFTGPASRLLILSEEP